MVAAKKTQQRSDEEKTTIASKNSNWAAHRFLLAVARCEGREEYNKTWKREKHMEKLRWMQKSTNLNYYAIIIRPTVEKVE